jgi:DNA-binding NarL/FixJ family response regulator
LLACSFACTSWELFFEAPIGEGVLSDLRVIRVVPATSVLVCARGELDGVGIREILRRFGIAADTDQSARAIRRLSDSDVDVLFVDVLMPSFGALVAAAMRRGTPALAFGGAPEPETAVNAIRAGCRGYIARDEPAAKWAEAATIALNGGTYLSPLMITHLVEDYQGRSEPLSAVIDHRLTEREWEILGLIAEGMTNKQVAAQLFISAETVRTHVSNILEKLGTPNRSGAAAKYHTLARAN